MKLKRIMALVLCFAMVLSTMSFSVFAEGTYIAKVSDVECADATEMLSTLNTASGEVIVEIYGKLETSGFGINNTNIEKLSFVGKTDNAEICVDGVAYIDVRSTQYPIEYTDLTLSHTNGAYGIDGRLQEYFSTYNGGDVTYTECTFPNGVTALGSTTGTTVTFNSCTFNNTTSGKYSLWVDGNGTNVVVNGGEFCGVRGAKLFAENGSAFSTLEVNGAKFFDTITEKAAVVLTRGEKVVLENNTFESATEKVEVDDDYASEIEGKTVIIDDAEYTVDSENLALEETTPAVTTVATVDGVPYTDIQEAIMAAAQGGTVEIQSDITVDTWNMFASDMTHADIITCDISKLTIKGNNHELTINEVVSGGNGGYLFYDANELNIYDLTINQPANGGICMYSGEISNVTFNGGEGIHPGDGNITITECKFNTAGCAIYYEAERDNLVVTGCEFTLPADKNVILLRGKTTFTNNVVNSGRTVNVVSGSPVVTGNDFGDVRLKVYNVATANIADNTINVLEFNDENTVNSTFGANTLSADAEQALKDAGVIEEPALSGEGTEENPYLINNIDDLVKFRDDVNAGNTYEGKYVALKADITFGEDYEEMNVNYKGNNVSSRTFRPIADEASGVSFKGTFDGENHTVSGLYQNGWDINYHWDNYGCAGLFGTVENATVKNLTMDNVEIQVEGGDVAAIAGHAIGDCTFENITVTNSKIATFNNGCAGIVAWSEAGEYTFKGITVTDSVVLAGLWGSFDSSIGGVLAQLDNNGMYSFEDVEVACRLDVYNDVTASYDYYNYRMCGMLIGRSQKYLSDTPNEVDLSNVTCKNVKITIGEWANYHYCDPTPGYNNGRGMRVEPGYTYDGLPADYDHSTCTQHHMTCIPMTSIVGGGQFGYTGTSAEELVEQGFDETELKVVDFAKIARSNVAKIGDTYFASLQDAVNEANDGDVITLINNINLADTDLQILDGNYDTYFLVEGKNIIIDLNGKTISGAYTGTNTMLVGVFSTDNGGHLTITGNGTIDVTATNKVYSLIANYEDGCTITIENGTYKLDKASDSLIYSGGYTDAAVTVKDGTFTLGNVGTGENGKPWIFNVLGAGDHHVLITGGTFNADINRQHWSNEAVVDENCYTVNNGNGTYTVKEGAVAYVKTGMVTGPFYAPKNIGYATLAEAVEAAVAANDSPVVLIKDIIDVEEFAINANSPIVLDLNGKTLNGAIKPSTGDITVKNGSIVNKNSGYSAIEINSGKLTLESVNIDSARHAVRIDGDVTAVVNGGIYKTIVVKEGVTQHAFNISGTADVTINDGTFTGPKGTAADSGSAINVKTGSAVTINNGNFSGGKLNTLSVGGTMAVYGGTFDQDPSAYVANGHKSFKNEDETYTVRSIKSDAYTVTADASATKVRYNNGNPDSFTVKYVATGGNVIGAMAQLEYDTELFVCDEDPNATGRIRMNNNNLTTTNGETVIKELHFKVKKNVEVDTTYEFIAKYVQVVSDFDAAGSGAQDGFVENVIGVDVTIIAQYDVTLPVDGSLEGNTYVDQNADYSATIKDFDENKIYTITYTMGNGEEQTIKVDKDSAVNNGFVIEDVTGNLVFTSVTSELNFELILLPEALTGYTLVLVKDGVSAGYTYNGAPMYAIDRYVGLTELVENDFREDFVGGDILGATSVRAILIKGGTTLEEARAAIEVATTASESLEENFDVNRNGQFFFNDAMTAHGCYKEQYELAAKMNWYLSTDVNTDFVLDTDDYDDTVEAFWATLD